VAVVKLLTWQALQLAALKSASPLIPERGVWGGGARKSWKSAWRSILSKHSPSGPSSGSGTTSHAASSAWLPLGAFSSVRKRLVRPISLSEASAEKLRSVAFWHFQPK